ncbi:MAG: hypothetical protein H6633_29620 [Anaerolineales bacterium]|nr:hypothetical protein [Anaerolineales bacterium]
MMRNDDNLVTNGYENIEKIYLIWNADWSIGVQAAKDFVSGIESCALCAIVYSGVKQKTEWKACQATIPVPIETVYKNKITGSLKAVVKEDFPAVVAETNKELIKLMGKAEVEACEGDVEKFRSALEQRMRKFT